MSDTIKKARKLMARINVVRDAAGALSATLPDGRVIAGEGKAVYKLIAKLNDLKKSEGLRARIVVEESAKRAKEVVEAVAG
jgi:ribulose-5-phosphate 4-epimerase/fuculose-1-phosphate aldolase